MAVGRVNNINKAFTRSERLLINIIIAVNTIGVYSVLAYSPVIKITKRHKNN